MKQARRFVAVGIANAAFTYLLYQLLNVFVIYEIAFTISFATGVLFSAFFNARYSFSIGLGLRALLRFTAVCLISYYLGLQVLIFCVEVLHIHEALAPLIVAAVMLPFTFVGSRAALTGQLTKR
ncbi:MAG: GtrA family protein [Alphaproteobacteria bacterium]|nr:GtrA family protein [Alphaproteobacteria bacterium]